MILCRLPYLLYCYMIEVNLETSLWGQVCKYKVFHRSQKVCHLKLKKLYSLSYEKSCLKDSIFILRGLYQMLKTQLFISFFLFVSVIHNLLVQTPKPPVNQCESRSYQFCMFKINISARIHRDKHKEFAWQQI